MKNYQTYKESEKYDQKFKKQKIEQDSWISELAEEILNNCDKYVHETKIWEEEMKGLKI